MGNFLEQLDLDVKDFLKQKTVIIFFELNLDCYIKKGQNKPKQTILEI